MDSSEFVFIFSVRFVILLPTWQFSIVRCDYYYKFFITVEILSRDLCRFIGAAEMWSVWSVEWTA